MISIAIVAFTAVIFLTLRRDVQFTLFSLVVLFPFTFGNFTSFPNFLIVEWLTIIVFLMLLNDLVSVRAVKKKINTLNFRGIGIFIFAIILLVIWLTISYINNEIMTEKIFFGEKTGIRRTYFDIINNILIFFSTIMFFAIVFRDLSVEKFLNTLLYITIIIGVMRIITFYFDIDTPLLAGSFGYNPSKHGTSLRYPGVDFAAMIGIPVLFSLYFYKKKINLFIFALFIFFLFLSGGRTALFGTILSILIFSFFFFPSNFIYLTIGLSLVVLVVVIFLPESFFSGQVNRFSTLQQTGFMGMDLWRGTSWKLFLENFNNNPFFGKGIGDYTGFIYSVDPFTAEFARAQQFVGGHGSYFSLLSTLGIGGIVYFILMVFGGIIMSFNRIRKYATINQDIASIAVFCFMFLIIESVHFIVGYNGLTDVQFMFYIVGLISAIRVLENKEVEIEEID